MRTLVLATLALFFLMPEEAQAQYGRGGRVNGGYYSGGSYWNRNPGWGYNRGWGFNQGWSGNRWGYGGIYADAYSYPTQPYVYTFEVPNSTTLMPRTSLYIEQGVSRSARVEVKLAKASDELLVQGQVVAGYGLTREVISPALTPGKEYLYTISVRRANSSTTQPGDTRTIDVKSGGSYSLDFTRPATEQPR